MSFDDGRVKRQKKRHYLPKKHLRSVKHPAVFERLLVVAFDCRMSAEDGKRRSSGEVKVVGALVSTTKLRTAEVEPK